MRENFKLSIAVYGFVLLVVLVSGCSLFSGDDGVPAAASINSENQSDNETNASSSPPPVVKVTPPGVRVTSNPSG